MREEEQLHDLLTFIYLIEVNYQIRELHNLIEVNYQIRELHNLIEVNYQIRELHN